MKTLICSLATILAIALSSTVFAAEHDVFEHHLKHEKPITGTVVEYGDMLLIIEDSKKERLTFNVRYFDQRYQPKVGDKVRVHYYLSRHGVWITDKVDKIDTAEGGSKKN
jgi:hypothetical protein